MYKTLLFILLVLSVFFATSAWAYDSAPEPTHVDGKVETIIKTNPTPKPEPKPIVKTIIKPTSKPSIHKVTKPTPTPKPELTPAVSKDVKPRTQSAPSKIQKLRSLPPIRFLNKLFKGFISGLISGLQVDGIKN